MSAAERKSIERGGARISYEVSGAGPTVVLGHSLLCDGRMWEGVAPRLAERHRVINVDVRGHGRSTATGAFSLEDLADDWRAILDEEKTPRAILCGLSMGGMTAMRLALASPERVAGLALLDTSADREPAFGRVKYRAMAELVRRFGWLRALEPSIRPVMFGKTSLRERPELVELGMARIREQDAGLLYFGVRAVIDRLPVVERLGALRVPVRVLVGAEDRATPPERARRITAAIPGATLAELPRAGHLSALEVPADVTRELTGFFATLAV